MKNHKIERGIPFSELEKVIEKYEDDGYEVAGITYREYHYDVIFKKISYQNPNYVYIHNHPWTQDEIKPIPTPYKPYCGPNTSSTDVPLNQIFVGTADPNIKVTYTN